MGPRRGRRCTPAASGFHNVCGHVLGMCIWRAALLVTLLARACRVLAASLQAASALLAERALWPTIMFCGLYLVGQGHFLRKTVLRAWAFQKCTGIVLFYRFTTALRYGESRPRRRACAGTPEAGL